MAIKLKPIQTTQKTIETNEHKTDISKSMEHIIQSRKIYIDKKDGFFFLITLFMLLVISLVALSFAHDFSFSKFIKVTKSFNFSNIILILSNLIFSTLSILSVFRYLNLKKKLKEIFNNPILNQNETTKYEIIIYHLGDIYTKNKVVCDEFMASLDNQKINCNEIIQRKNLLSEQDVKDIESIIEHTQLVRAYNFVHNRMI